jgi:hypothetical protein
MIKVDKRKQGRDTMTRVFGSEICEQARKNVSKKGLNGANVKDVLVVMACHFNDEVDDVRTSLRKSDQSLSHAK